MLTVIGLLGFAPRRFGLPLAPVLIAVILWALSLPESSLRGSDGGPSWPSAWARCWLMSASIATTRRPYSETASKASIHHSNA
jgi:hypothetical protein